MTRLILLIGLPGSGKSFLARQLVAECPSRQLISTDSIRAELFGAESVQGPWVLIWREVQRQFQHAAIARAEAIYDATNAECSGRREAIALARETGFDRISGVWLDMPVQICLQRNQQRSRQVPDEVIWRMNDRLCSSPPALRDGFDEFFHCSPAGLSTEIAIAP